MSRVRTKLVQLMAQKQASEGRIITPTIVAREADVSRQAVYGWLNDDLQRFDEKMLRKLCDYFNCDIGDLLYMDRQSN